MAIRNIGFFMLAFSLVTAGAFAAADSVIYVNAAGGSSFTDTNVWNGVNFNQVRKSGYLKDKDGADTTVRVWVLQPAAGSNMNANQTYTGDAAEFEPVRAANGGLIHFCANDGWNGNTRRPKMTARVTGLDPDRFYTFTFVGARANSSGDYSSTYTVEGATSGSDWLMAANNTSRVARIPGIVPHPDGCVEFSVQGRSSSNSGFGYLQAFKIEASAEPPPTVRREIFVDACDTPAADSERTWNGVNFCVLGASSKDLLDRDGVATGIGLTVTKAGARNAMATSALTGDAAEFNAARSGSGQVFGNTGNHDGIPRLTLEATLNGLNPAQAYDFTFLASRMGSANDLSTRYTAIGANEATVVLDAANNTSRVATAAGVRPKADGTVQLVVSKGEANNHSVGYFYILAFKITTSTETIPPGTRRVAVAATTGGTVSVAAPHAAAAPYAAWLAPGETLAATAAPEPGWHFAAWTSDHVDAPVTTPALTVSADRSVTWTAVFEKDDAPAAKTVYVDAMGTPGADTKTWNVFTCLYGHRSTQAGFLAADGSWTPLVLTMDQELGAYGYGDLPINGEARAVLTGEAADFEAARSGGSQNFIGINHGSGSTGVTNVLEASCDVAGLNPDHLYTFRFAASRMNGSANYDTRYRAVGANAVSCAFNPSNVSDRVATLAYVRPAPDGTVRVTIAAGPENSSPNCYFYLLAASVAGDFEPPVPSAARRILWFGNSFSIVGDIPTRVADLAALAGYPRPVVVPALSGGKNLAYHIGQVKAAPQENVLSTNLLMSGTNNWDDVVIQGYSTEATDAYDVSPETGFLPNATNLFGLVRASARGGNVRAVLYETWARQPGNAEFYPVKFPAANAMQDQITANYRAAERLVKGAWGAESAVVAPCGRAFRKLGYDAALYAADLYHQGGKGQDLLAMVLFNRIYGVYVDDLVTYGQARDAGWTTVSEPDWTTLVRAARAVFAPAGSMVLVR